MKNRLLTMTVTAAAAGLIGVAMLGSTTVGASAQDKKPATAAAPAAPAADAEPKLAGEPAWFKICSKQGDNDICNTQYTMIADTRQLVTAINLIDVKGKVNQKVLQAVVPTGRVIPAGVRMQIDQNAAQALNYSVCFPDRCIAEAQLTDAMIASMKKGNSLTVTSVNFQRQPNPVKVKLSGFKQAFDGPATEQTAIAQRQQELNDALQKQAEARRKKFDEAQAAAKAGTAPAAPAQ